MSISPLSKLASHERHKQSRQGGSHVVDLVGDPCSLMGCEVDVVLIAVPPLALDGDLLGATRLWIHRQRRRHRAQALERLLDCGIDGRRTPVSMALTRCLCCRSSFRVSVVAGRVTRRPNWDWAKRRNRVF